jgi:hypothetical protein
MGLHKELFKGYLRVNLWGYIKDYLGTNSKVD